MEHTVARENDLAPGTMLGTMVGQTRVVVFRHDDGTLSALEDRCSHADVKLSKGCFKDGEVTCPAHGARFDSRTGAPRCMPAVRAVRAFPVTTSDGDVKVEVPE